MRTAVVFDASSYRYTFVIQENRPITASTSDPRSCPFDKCWRATMDWYELQARCATRDIWVNLKWEGMPELGPYLLPDGRDVSDLLADGDVDQVPFPVWWEPGNRGVRRGDLLWTTGGKEKIASRRFIEVLESIGATGYRTFEIDLRERGGEPMDGYVGFATTHPADDTDIRPLHGWQNFVFLANERVVVALHEAGADQLLIERSAQGAR